MFKMENLMLYGILCCTDIFVSVLTLIPLRCFVTIIKCILWPVRYILLGPRKFIHQSQVMDLARIALVLITCYCSYSPLLYWNTSGATFLGMTETFFVKDQNFWERSKFLAKVKTFVNDRNFFESLNLL